MKKILLAMSCLMVVTAVFALPAHADLNNFLTNLNKQAKADINHFNAVLSSEFKIPLPNVKAILGTVKDPADVFMCFQLSRMTGIPVEKVVSTYKQNSGQGWGVIAKQLGIQPGSAAFHALKNGNFVFDSQHKVKKKKSKSKGKGKKEKKKK